MAAYAEAVHPQLFHLGRFSVPTYGVAAAVGLVCALALAEWCAPRAGVAAERVSRLCLWTLSGTLVLSRVALFAQSPSAFLRYALLMLSLPTLTRYGLILGVACGAVYVWRSRMPWLPTLDALAPAVLLLAAFLHVGSGLAGTDAGVALGSGRPPVALYAAALALVGALLSLMTLLHQQRAGNACGVGLAALAIGEYIVGEMRPDAVFARSGVPGFLRTDQIALLLLVVAGMLLLMDWKRNDA